MNIAVTITALALFSLAACSQQTETVSEKKPETVITAPERPAKIDIELDGFAVIRELAPNDRAALFGLLPKRGRLEITQVAGPSFIRSYQVGELNETSIQHVFTNSARPPSEAERAELLAKYKGAIVIYFEGYEGELCTTREQSYAVVARGKVDDVAVEVTFRFEALPNRAGNCAFHVFGTETRYTN